MSSYRDQILDNLQLSISGHMILISLSVHSAIIIFSLPFILKILKNFSWLGLSGPRTLWYFDLIIQEFQTLNATRLYEYCNYRMFRTLTHPWKFNCITESHFLTSIWYQILSSRLMFTKNWAYFYTV